MKRITLMIIVESLIILVLATGVINASSMELPTYKLGIDASWPPWSWYEAGEFRGLDIELLNYIAKEEGFKLEYVDLPFSSQLAAISKGKLDILAAGLSCNRERWEAFDYALVYYIPKCSFAVRKDSNLDVLTMMNVGRKVSVLGGTTSSKVLKKRLAENGIDIEIVEYDSADLAIKEVENGRIDAFFSGTSTIIGYMDAGRNIKELVGGIVAPPEIDVGQAYAVSPGDPHGLIQKLNNGIRKAYESGEWARLMQKYLPWEKVEKVPYLIDYASVFSEMGNPLPTEIEKRAKENYEKYLQSLN